MMCMYTSYLIVINNGSETVVTQSTQNKVCIHVLTWCRARVAPRGVSQHGAPGDHPGQLHRHHLWLRLVPLRRQCRLQTAGLPGRRAQKVGPQLGHTRQITNVAVLHRTFVWSSSNFKRSSPISWFHDLTIKYKTPLLYILTVVSRSTRNCSFILCLADRTFNNFTHSYNVSRKPPVYFRARGHVYGWANYTPIKRSCNESVNYS